MQRDEEAVAFDCLKFIYSSVRMIHSQLLWKSKFEAGIQTTQHFPLRSLISLHTELWYQLSYPHSTEVRQLTHSLTVLLELIINLHFPILHSYKFKIPSGVCTPSLSQQLIHRPITILDPYIQALHRNYYYPIAPVEEESVSMADDNQMQVSSPKQSPQKKPPSSVPITVESSIQAIADLIKEVEADDPPTESVPSPIAIELEKQNTFTHRFAIYRKQTYPTPGAPPNQLALFKSFVKSIKSADQSACILPIRSDVKIYPLSTTDQINSLEHIGLTNYFKPYKRTQKTLSGDFCISTKLPFESVRDHPAFNTWLMHQGYYVTYNACQTADMVKIGFLSRVRGFTFRGDLQDYIMGSAEWKASPFHFRLYFDAFTVRGKTAHVLMIDVDRPNIELGIRFFQQWYNGTLKNSPNNLPYMFWPLFKKTYSDEERLKIIIDNAYHISTDSVIGVTGLHPLDSIVQLINGTYTTIRKLLLSIPASGTVTGQLFLQVERQTTNDWLLCCFYQQDTSKVTLRLGTLEESLRKCTHPTSIPLLFTSSSGLSFTNQVGQLAKGRNRLPRLEVPSYTADYVSQSMERLYTPTAKRQATEMDASPTNTEGKPAAILRVIPTTYAAAAAPVTPLATTTQTDYSSTKGAELFQDLRATTNQHSSTLAELRKCCESLAISQQSLSKNVTAMNDDMNKKFSILVEANEKFDERFNQIGEILEHLQNPTASRPSKMHKDIHGLPDITFQG